MRKVKYFLSYDLIDEKNYQKIYDELSSFKAVRILKSVWCFKYEEGSASDLKDHFKKFIDKDDRLIIIESVDWASVRLEASPNTVK